MTDTRAPHAGPPATTLGKPPCDYVVIDAEPSVGSRLRCVLLGSPLRTAFTFAVAGRLLYSALAALYVPFIRLNPDVIGTNHFTEHLMPFSTGWQYRLLGVWERFDTLWYVHIAQFGYDRPDAVVFYPLYPMLLRISHLPPLLASVLIATVAAFAFALGFQKVVELDYRPEVGHRALAVYLAWPAGFMLFAGYAESLVLACIVWAIYFARRENAWATAACALLAAFSKAVGAVVLVPVVIIAVRRRNWRLLASAAASASPVLLAIWAWGSGHMAVTQAYSSFWKTRASPPWTTSWLALTSGDELVMLNLVIAVIVLALALARRSALEYTAFTLCALAVLLSKQTDPLLQSMMRYVLVIFPAFINAGRFFQSRWRFAVFMVALFAIELKVLHIFLDWGLVV
jgi:hypothetical protein